MGLQRVKFRREAFGEIASSPEVRADLERRARAVATKAGPGMAVDTQVIARRYARASVRTATVEAIRAQRRSKALSRAFDAARGD